MTPRTLRLYSNFRIAYKTATGRFVGIPGRKARRD